MATTPVATTSAWTLVAGSAGLKRFNLSAGGVAYEYAVAASLPAASFIGAEVSPGSIRPVDVPAGQNLYLRKLNGAGSGSATNAFVEDVN